MHQIIIHLFPISQLPTQILILTPPPQIGKHLDTVEKKKREEKENKGEDFQPTSKKRLFFLLLHLFLQEKSHMDMNLGGGGGFFERMKKFDRWGGGDSMGKNLFWAILCHQPLCVGAVEFFLCITHHFYPWTMKEKCETLQICFMVDRMRGGGRDSTAWHFFFGSLRNNNLQLQQ